MEQKLYAECARMGEKIPYWTVGGVYKEDYAKKTSTGGPTASGAVSSGSFIMPQKMNFIWKQPEKMKIYWIRTLHGLHRPSPRYRFHVAPQRCR